MNLVGKYVLIIEEYIKANNGLFCIVDNNAILHGLEHIVYIFPKYNTLLRCYQSPVVSNINKAIIDWDKYQESNKENIKTMLIGEDESARQLALEILKQYNCVIL